MARMQAMSQKDTKTLERLCGQLADPCSSDKPNSRKFDRCPGAYMALHVERIGERMFSLAHYNRQTGDATRDPEVVFFRDEAGRWYPVTFQQDGIRNPYTVAAECDENGIVHYWPRRYRELRAFVLVWLRNLRAQQGVA